MNEDTMFKLHADSSFCLPNCTKALFQGERGQGTKGRHIQDLSRTLAMVSPIF